MSQVPTSGRLPKMAPGEQLRVAVIGTGHVGLITCTSLAAVGHEVVGNDADPEKIELLRSGRMPFYEPDVADLLDRCLDDGRLRFTRDTSDAVAGADVVFICVGTPPRASGKANLVAVEQAARQVAREATGPLVIAEKSTVPAGTAELLQRTVRLERPELAASIDVVSNPEFLREGRALHDALEPDRILVGASTERAFEVMRRLYRPFIERGVRLIETNIATAELAKHACNAFLAMKISYANALARICERADGDVMAIVDVMGADARIGREFLGAGLGYGGYCFPKDLIAFERLAADLGYELPLLSEVAKINDDAVDAALHKVRDALWNLEDKRVALFGLAFKPGTDDVRFSPALALARGLLEEGATVVGYDPYAATNAGRDTPGLELADDPYDAAQGAHCIVLSTGWPEFRELDIEKMAEIVTFPILVDARNFLDPEEVVAAGFSYYPMGRPTVHPPSRHDHG
ncbi:MAG TPA: UDP-glucose/GDP-mannose dehydrogenase family protein [Actinomycetota bacterium]|nr:UDP-glucose/GDP-mannose dehydrogenase family protein [Actinomycetota bacterium]